VQLQLSWVQNVAVINSRERKERIPYTTTVVDVQRNCCIATHFKDQQHDFFSLVIQDQLPVYDKCRNYYYAADI